MGEYPQVTARSVFRSVEMALIFAFWGCVVVGMLWPLLGYKRGTSENVSVELVAEPFIDSPNLVYRWTGDVVRSCPVEIRRRIVDAFGVETTLTSEAFSAIPAEHMGHSSYEISVPVPLLMAEGPAYYQASEVPLCSWMQRLWPVSIPYPRVDFIVRR